jgi:hypothetical protein
MYTFQRLLAAVSQIWNTWLSSCIMQGPLRIPRSAHRDCSEAGCLKSGGAVSTHQDLVSEPIFIISHCCADINVLHFGAGVQDVHMKRRCLSGPENGGA